MFRRLLWLHLPRGPEDDSAGPDGQGDSALETCQAACSAQCLCCCSLVIRASGSAHSLRPAADLRRSVWYCRQPCRTLMSMTLLAFVPAAALSYGSPLCPAVRFIPLQNAIELLACRPLATAVQHLLSTTCFCSAGMLILRSRWTDKAIPTVCGQKQTDLERSTVVEAKTEIANATGGTGPSPPGAPGHHHGKENGATGHALVSPSLLLSGEQRH